MRWFSLPPPFSATLSIYLHPSILSFRVARLFLCVSHRPSFHPYQIPLQDASFRLSLPRWRQAMLCDWNLYARRGELNPHNLLSHLRHTQSIQSVIAVLWEADVRLPWFSCMCNCSRRRVRGARWGDRTWVAGSGGEGLK